MLKLLSKAAEDRYQSALGLKVDLERCLEQLEASGRIESFTLDTHDVSEHFRIPQKLYGRDKELAELMDAFDRVTETGRPELVLVAGYAGIGKSALVHELHRPVVRQHGLLLSGKFDQYKRDIPYSAITQAFRELVQQILAEGEENIAVWKRQLQAAVGINGRLVVDIIPAAGDDRRLAAGGARAAGHRGTEPAAGSYSSDSSASAPPASTRWCSSSMTCSGWTRAASGSSST